MIENKLQGGYATDMDEYAKSIIPIIEANYEKYTETERYIADYFLKQARPERLSAELVSKELSVSVASLSRFAKNVVLAVTGSSRMNFVIPMWKNLLWSSNSPDWF